MKFLFFLSFFSSILFKIITLFILSGILIIFLCEQIYRIAALSGMKETMTTLSPLLKELKDLKL